MRCPLLNKDCIQDKCAWWLDFWKREKPGDEPHVEKNCVVIELPTMLIEVIRNTNGEAATNEQLRNRMEHVIEQTARNNTILAGMAEMALRQGQAGLPTAKSPIVLLDGARNADPDGQ